ncbi:hypothetical protein SDC9_126870 [bioreactor metagenome]|uniref:Homoserine kinase n=1 Tax=bioreactor metagenome TaxID=1076179 RepID=A0A645CSI7_9ZZZZ
MNIELTNIIEVLNLYKLTTEVSNYNFFINGYDNETCELKIIVKVEFLNGNPLVVKFVKEDHHPYNVIESQSVFSEYLRSHGILTPKRYMTNGKYCNKYKLNNLLLDVSVEDYLGEEIKAIDFKIAYKIGALMGRIHRISESGNCHICNDTIFNVIGYNEVIGYKHFLKLGEDGKVNSSMYKMIQSLYNTKLERIKSLWSNLPRYATQGDISINNLTYIGGEIGIFDYNIAGDETLIGDMVLEGLLVANEMDLSIELSENDRTELFKHFLNGYVNERPLTENEKAVLCDIYSISSAMWFTKIKHNENSLTKLLEREDSEKIDSLLHEIYNTLSKDNFQLLE